MKYWDRKIVEVLKYAPRVSRIEKEIWYVRGGPFSFWQYDVHWVSFVLRMRRIITHHSSFHDRIDRKMMKVLNYTCFEHPNRKSSRSRGEKRGSSFIQDQYDAHSETSCFRARCKSYSLCIVSQLQADFLASERKGHCRCDDTCYYWADCPA